MQQVGARQSQNAQAQRFFGRGDGLMKIGIIGAGNIGSALTHRLRAAGHDVAIANSRGPASLRDLASETGAQAVTVQEAVRGRDLVIITIPERNISQLPQGLFDGIPGDVVVVDTGNYYPRQRDGRIEPIENGLPESAWVARQIGRPVVKAFNTIYAQHLLENGKPKATPGRIALPVAGDDAKAKAVVMRLIDEIGFDAVDAGPLSESWRQQPGSPVYAQDYDAAGVRRSLSEALPQRQPSFTGTANSPGSFDAPA
ncbi:MAG: NAD(P)-binding domain-containing protein [Candidatus Eremiobacteraeota bacterium]|nr:NAD(P)-binding domain-containing protein [Candidatus Eremiobacteraeota bacterium]